MLPALSTARYRYFHSPLTRMYVSSIRQLQPTARLQRRNAFSSTGKQFERPAMHGRMVNRNPSLDHHLLEVAQTQRIRNIPAHAEKDYIKRIVQTLEHLRHSWIQVLLHRSDRSFSGLQHSRSLIATKPRPAITGDR